MSEREVPAEAVAEQSVPENGSPPLSQDDIEQLRQYQSLPPQKGPVALMRFIAGKRIPPLPYPLDDA
jgi:hypothetical protein